MGRELTIWAGSVLWFAAAGSGLWLWDRYGNEPGRFADVPNRELESPAGRWELTLYAHPHCPCVRDALAALGGLAREHSGLAVRVAFVRPPGAPDGWEHTPAWAAAAALPGVGAFCDADGGAARRAGAETSGAAVLIDPSGRVAFRGGLTASRHGRAPGPAAVRAWLSTGTGPASAPVFGCPLFDRD